LAERDHDVAIAGGGMVGAALALALAQRGFSVVLLEARPPLLDWDDAGYDLRVSALTRVSQQLLRNLGVWEDMVADRVTPYQCMHVWERAGFGEIHFDAADLSEPDLGHIVENRVIVRALWRRLEEAGVALRVPAAVARQDCAEQGVTLWLDDGSELRAGLLVGADGARSQVRERAGIESRGEDYDQHAVVATVHAGLGNQSTAWQRFMPAGPLALLPLGDELFSIVWSTSPDQALRLCELPVAEFDQRLSEASEGRCGRLSLRGERAAFPLRLQHAGQYVAPGLALVGDAAHVIHPLAGQGVNLGFLDAAELVDTLVDGRDRGRPYGALRTLRRYERARRGHNTATQLAMDGFKHLFSNDSPLLAALRNTGLAAAGRVPPLRRLFERVALGQGLELPTLSRPPHSRPG
jgi:2-octaprenylphenol hydroxylase